MLATAVVSLVAAGLGALVHRLWPRSAVTDRLLRHLGREAMAAALRSGHADAWARWTDVVTRALEALGAPVPRALNVAALGALDALGAELSARADDAIPRLEALERLLPRRPPPTPTPKE